MELTDGTVRLRRLRVEDADRIVAACRDAASRRFLPALPDPYTAEDAREYVQRVHTRWVDGSGHAYAIVASHEGQRLIGSVDLHLGDPASIGYWVHPDARGRGVATRALILLSRWALIEGGSARLELTTHPANMASQRVAEKAGFVREGVLRSHMPYRDGRRRDSVLFSLVPADLEFAAVRA